MVVGRSKPTVAQPSVAKVKTSAAAVACVRCWGPGGTYASGSRFLLDATIVLSSPTNCQPLLHCLLLLLLVVCRC
jgi:hypothetical protein